MPRAYSLDLCERVLKDCVQEMSSEDAARKYSVSIAPQKYKPGLKRKLEPYEQGHKEKTYQGNNLQFHCPFYE